MEFLLFPLKAILVFFDASITAVTFGWVGTVKKLFSRETLRTVPVDNDEAHRVHPKYKNNLVSSPGEGIHTLFDMTNDAFSRHSARECVGSREFLGWKTPKVKHFGSVKYRTYEEVGILSHKFGASLRKQGLVAAPDKATLNPIVTPCTIAIFENTCCEWLIAAMGAFSQSFTVTTIYATLGLDAVVTAVNDGSIPAIVCNKSNVAKLIDRISDMPSLKTIVYTSDLVAPDDRTPLPSPPPGVKIFEFFDFCASGNTQAFPPNPPAPDSCAVIMYTSGSTGKAKGVVIPHRALLGTCAAQSLVLGLKEGEDVYLGYLPLAHILELVAELCMIAQGCTICYADPKSLTKTGAYPLGALEQYSPTIMAAVPKIWDVIKKGVEAKIAASSPVARFLVATAFQAKRFAMNHGYDTPLFNALVFRKFSAVVGGKMRFALTGGGPINAEVQEFIRTCFGFPLVQGYGLTETCAGLTVQAAEDFRPGIAGVAIPSVEIKLESTPEVTDKAGQSYMSTDRTDHEGNKVFGRGEILVRGTNVTLGYYQMPEKTAGDFRRDGFFMTGDIGQFMADGSLRIVDRKKNLVKLKGGEYIALERMEAVYGNSIFVDAIAGGICCYGDGEMDRPVALVQLSQQAAMQWAKDSGLQGDWTEIKSSTELYDAIMVDFYKEHKKAGLSSLEKLIGICLLDKPWTPENGCLTAANKLQRRAVVSAFHQEFQDVKRQGIF